MVQCSGLSVRILINGAACTEYDIPEPDPEVIESLPPSNDPPPKDNQDVEGITGENATSEEPESIGGKGSHYSPLLSTKISKFVQIESGACFAIECKVLESFDLRGFNTVGYDIFLDGKYLIGKLLFTDETGRLSKTSTTCDKTYLADGKSAQPLKFGKIITRDAATLDNMAHLKASLAKLGTITVRVCRANSVVDVLEFEWAAMRSPAEGEIPETALKGRSMSSRTTFGDVIQMQHPAVFRKYEKCESPGIATFHLRYRSKSDLQILGIVPRSPSPENRDDEDLESMTPEELKAMLRKTKAKLESDMRIKKEKMRAGPRVGSAGTPDAQAIRGVKRPRTPTMEEDDELSIVRERPVGARTRSPSENEVIYISD